jgi:hypothetical protein
MAKGVRARSVIAGAAAATVIAATIVAGIRTHDLVQKNHRLQHGLSAFERTALSTARSYAIEFATYRYDNLDANFAATEAHAVDPFLTQYRNTIDQLRASVTKVHATSTADVLSAGLVSISAKRAVVDLFLDQSIVNIRGSRTLSQRVQITLVRRNGKWLISNVVLP